MSCEKCRAAFAHNPPHEIATQVSEATEEICGCEAFRMAETSPGIVRDIETLHLIISDPTDIQDGRLNPASLIRIDTSGLSVLRQNAINEEFDLTIQELKNRSAAAQRPRFFLGVCLFTAEAIRYQSGERFMGVYDTALPGKDNHADVVAPPLLKNGISNTQFEKEKRKRIKELIGLVGRCFDPAKNFRDGVFLKHSS